MSLPSPREYDAGADLTACIMGLVAGASLILGLTGAMLHTARLLGL
ncbi:hypothetical protein JQ557_24540 [Bradyrhizobium sp. U87765 SZCCT0131]|nr:MULTISPECIES: hypothetical protein [unclassified Bradyrhizobium]MBR1221190.1 hypothetical protein [Bradyrhizobium sp. U87765 SZCCT0131]MBR1259989.1 hypothetical protein [Bradyrhizobium sp. U87765 SZCCT0134]MBR1307762.1 hypothetical protein [Bradyrhizobium sp. U87765 SZCCT0110]MBR1321716.1 hypothetical protein [Bradyrhizobium sp. U87765 SZCCT0109]MBR1350028.1 hypothetical protein [Bradyrhizobium sp. U87765 SZCCT0048]